MKTPAGDLRLANEYLERVAASNAEEVPVAAEMLTELKVAIGLVKEKGHMDDQSQAVAASQLSTSIT